MNGITKNKGKKSDSFSDVMPSLKNDSGANVGEVYLSRNANRLSFKKGPKNPIRILTEEDLKMPIVGEYIITSAEFLNTKNVSQQLTPHLGLGTYYTGIVRIELHPGDVAYSFGAETMPAFRFLFSDGNWALPFEQSCNELPDNNKTVWIVDLNNQMINDIRTNISSDTLTREENGLFLKIYGNADAGDYIDPLNGNGYLRVVYELNAHVFGA